MSRFTNFLNLFMWNIETDGEEEFDIERALNDNWDKIDTMASEINDDISEINDNISEINSNIENLNTLNNETAEKIYELETTRQDITLTTKINENTNYTLPKYYTVGDSSLQLYFEGELLLNGEHYEEVGNSGARSNVIKMLFEWETDYKMTIIVKGDGLNEQAEN